MESEQTANDLGLPPRPLSSDSEETFGDLAMRALSRTDLTAPEDDAIQSL